MKKYLTYCIGTCLLAMSTLILSFSTAHAQAVSQTLTGYIVNEHNNPIAGALIQVFNSRNATISKEDGSFTLNQVGNASILLEISAIGYKDIRVLRGKDNPVVFKMETDASSEYNEVPLTYNSRPQYTVTAAAATVSGEELAKSPALNLKAALAGRLPGLYVRQSGAMPGAETFTFNVRGTSTQNGRVPLIIIDGVVSDNIDFINVQDVEKVTVYKDAAALAVWGMQGGNGAIAITTKRGNAGAPRVHVNVDYTVQRPLNTPSIVNAGQYAQLLNQAYENDGYGSYYYYTEEQERYFVEGTNRELYPDNDWYNMFMKPVVQTQNINASVSGGSERIRYYSNINYIHQDGPFYVEQERYNPKQSLNRYGFRNNIDVNLNRYLNASMTLYGYIQRRNGSRTNVNGIYSSLFNLPPTQYGPLTPDGKVVATPTVLTPPYALINRNGYQKQTTGNINVHLNLDLDMSFLLKGLRTTASAYIESKSVGTINGGVDYERWVRDETNLDELIFTKHGNNVDQPLTLTKSNTYNYQAEFKWTLGYSNTFGKHGVNALGFIRTQYKNAADLTLGFQPYLYMTYGGILNYNFNRLVYVDLAASYDGSEQFAPGRRYGLFPVVSAGYVLSNHEFLKNNKVLTYLKIRGSYGQVGNDQLLSEDRFLYLDNIKYETGGFIGNLKGTIDEIQKGNPNLTWETSTIANVGLEVGLFNQFTLGVDLFRDYRRDILMAQQTVPNSQGVPLANLAPSNIGEVLNKGFEVTLSYVKNFNKDWDLNIQGNFSFNRNKIIKTSEILYDTERERNERAVGLPIGTIWGYRIDYSNGNGYFNSLEEISESGLSYTEMPAPRPGDFRYVDRNGDKKINSADMVILGKSNIPEISWGMNINVRWKNVDASIFMQGLDNMSMTYSGCGFHEYYQGGTYVKRHLNAWTYDRYITGQPIDAPALSTQKSASHQTNSYFVYDKGFARLKNVEIGYTLPKQIAKKIKCQSIRVYLSGQNLFTLDRMDNDDLDVEMSALTSYPTCRYYNAGLSLIF